VSLRFNPCALVPTYDNPDTIGPVVDRVRTWLPDVIVVDDGSREPGRQAVQALASTPRVHVHRRGKNGGKGAAVKDGFRIAHGLDFTHALQIDADGQHQLEDIPRFLEAARAQPWALILGAPLFDASAPKARLIGRQITRFWANLETYGKRVIQDPMCGFRVYPLDAAIRADAKGNAMDFDPEIAVRMVWGQTPVVNLPTRIRYLTREAGGVSHFRRVRDDALISWMHTRLMLGAILRLVFPS
jgi:glycosyltransferase involved in cell wall biosynthesis